MSSKKNKSNNPGLKKVLDKLYAKFDDPRHIGLDPVGFLHRYDDPADREIAGLLASSLAFGRVAHINRSVGDLFARLGEPLRKVPFSTPLSLRRRLAGFRHRWVSARNVVGLIRGAACLIERCGSLEKAMAGFFTGSDETMGGLDGFCGALHGHSKGGCGRLIPVRAGRSASKRLNLFLRWMVRSDRIDPGGWTAVSPSALIVPLDTHMHRFGLRMGFTARRAADLKTASEVTAAFARLAPDDPVRYDFALTRAAIEATGDIDALVRANGMISR